MRLTRMMMRDQEVKFYIMHHFGRNLPKAHFLTDKFPICRTTRLEDLRRARTQMYVDREEEDDKEAEEEEQCFRSKKKKGEAAGVVAPKAKGGGAAVTIKTPPNLIRYRGFV